jgi:hypothetical protein
LANFYALPEGSTVRSRFSCFFNGSSINEVYGDAILTKSLSTVTLILSPQYPLWAKEARAMKYTIVLGEKTALVNAVMEN